MNKQINLHDQLQSVALEAKTKCLQNQIRKIR